MARTDLAKLVASAGEAGADLIVCPEMASTGYIWPSSDALRAFAEPQQGPTLNILGPLARQYQSWIVCGFAEQHGSTLYNAALVINPQGELSHCYRKVLLYAADTTWARPVDRRMSCDTGVGRMVPAICMYLNDEGLIRYLIRGQADVLAFCTNWVEEGIDVHPYWRWRLMGWSGWLVAANSWGEDSGTRFSGRSAVMAPGGKVVASAEPVGDAVLVVDTEALDASTRKRTLRRWLR